MMDTAVLGTLGGALASVGSFVFGLLCKSRVYLSTTNKVETDALMDMLSRSALSVREMKPQSKWIPTGCSVGWAFAACTTVTTSQYDPHVQTYELNLYRPSCLPWDWLAPGSRGGRAAEDGCEKDGCEKDLPATLQHMVIQCPRKDWPQPWGFEERSVFPPGTCGEALGEADRIARRARELLNENGSGVFVVRGPGARGKSSAGWRLAQLLGAHTIVLKEYDPTEAGLMFSEVLQARKQFNEDAYLFVELDEWDKFLHKIAVTPEGEVEPPGIAAHPKLRTDVLNKAGWHRLLHNVLTSKRIVVWMPANVDDERLKEYDPTVLRGCQRVTAHYKWDEETSRFVVVHEDVTVDPPGHMSVSRDSDLKEPLLLNHMT